MIKSNKVYVIAEAVINHNGSIKNAIKMIDKAKKAGADCIKFQAFNINNLLSPIAKTARYQKSQTGESLQRNILKGLNLSKKDFRIIFKECKNKEIDFLCTAFDKDWLKYLISLGMSSIKIPSGEITNFPYLKLVAQTQKPIILSTGMSKMIEIQKAIAQIKMYNESANISILHCTSLYPAPVDTLNLSAIETISKKFKLTVGYSDHSIGNLASITAIAMGARIIEKHFTLDKNYSGPDHMASVTYKELKLLIKEIRTLESAIGNGKKEPHLLEIDTLNVARRSWHARRNIRKGDIINKDDIILLRPGFGISGDKVLVGKKSKKNIKKGELIRKQSINNEKI